ncbi:MAG TPA: tannase/feruloyl esterase family alpha/beta hydrolase [Steroidobacteraceae bacterium]|nr:tannase/feruloyl esterase family alpha/beta hydrolase [Steroidobacteraceae bacterium]
MARAQFRYGRSGALLLVAALLLSPAPRAALAANAEHADCVALMRLTLRDTHILAAQIVDGPSFTPPGAERALADLPAFCRVAGVIRPAIRFEVWLPLAGWNGKFEGTGNGGYAGAIVYRELADGIRRRYATANTDMGHESTTPDPGRWALGHPELVVDQGYRAQFETTVKAKAIVRAFYHAGPRRSYFVGCSSGGWQGLTEAQRYPHQYDGIVAGAPAMEVIHLHAGTIWTNLAALEIAPAKFRLITDAVLAECDANDGVKDGLLTDPRTCHFSPAELACKAGQNAETCLTPTEVTALQHIYDGLHFSSGEPIYPGWPRGVEYALTLTRTPFVAALASSTFKDMVFEDPSWDYHRIDYDRAVRLADRKVGAILNNASPDLRAFRRAGGKLILWHGWADPLISPLHTLEYYQQVAAYFAGSPGRANGADEKAQIAAIQDFARLFLAPGVNHCGGGPGPDQFDALGALAGWVERGVAPERIVASHLTHGAVDRTRPLCAYPRVAVYRGQGSTDQAASFDCR